jgi:hypothetical protein
MNGKRKSYHAYMLRIWLMDNDNCPRWRLSLEEPHGEFIIIFNNLAELIVFLLITLNDSTAKRVSDPPQNGENLI